MNRDNDPFLMNVNELQKKAILHEARHLLIVAGPGTGKTHTLIQRILYFVQKLAHDQNILAITFSNRAADEMQARMEKKWPSFDSQSFIGTFHSFCLDLLRQFIDKTELPQEFSVKTPKEIEECLEILWSDKSPKERKNLAQDISLWKATKFGSKEPEWVTEYNAYLRGLNILDFDDLLFETVKLFILNDTVLHYVQKMYPYIFIDEYQDINSIQHTLVKLLMSKDSYVTAIGDPNQAIYGFRGSDVRFFAEFMNEFSSAVCVHLSDNYRSASTILDASSQVIAHAAFEVPPLTANLYCQGMLKVHHAPTEKAEAEYVIHEIEKMLGGISHFSIDSGRVDDDNNLDVTFSDIAVIYRLNAQRKYLEEALKRIGMPYQVSGDSSHYVLDEFDYDVERIHLLTMHASKGLEFKVVFILGCEENLIPLNIEGLKTDQDEERRLFYVAMTRAKERLYFTTSKKRMLFGKFYDNTVSPFVLDIEESLKRMDVNQKKFKKKEKLRQLDLFS